jgi:hypothetical protein
MNRRPAWLPAAGGFLLAFTNVVVLGGVAYNRLQPPDSVLALTERELGPQWSWMWRERENSGMSLRLEYRVESARLDRDKLAALGFDVAPPLTDANAENHYRRMLGRDVLLVLELDGPARARSLEAARSLLARQERESDANPGRDDNAQRLQSARQGLASEEQAASRLFIVDAGLNQTMLREIYPDRAHYAIVHGTIRPLVMRDGTSSTIVGAVTAVDCESIHVPLEFRATFPVDHPAGGMAAYTVWPEQIRPFTLQLAFGRRLEPWILSVRAGTI